MKFSMPWMKVLTWQVACCVKFFTGRGGWSVNLLADISPIFTFCSGQFIVSFIYLSKMLYAMLSIGVKVKVQ